APMWRRKTTASPRKKSSSFSKDPAARYGSVYSTVSAMEEWQKQMKELENQIKDMSERHGPLHAKTLTLMNQLAQVHREANTWEEAIQVYHEVHDGCKKALGEAHPYTLASLSNLGNCLFEMDRLEEAKPLLEETLQKQSHLRGEKLLGSKSGSRGLLKHGKPMSSVG
ncbi:unnamed protein product, partial [Durusdinium trenchii]